MTRSQKMQLAAVMTAASLLYLVHSLLRFRNFEAKGYDLGIFDQAVRQYALFSAPIVPIKGEDFHLLGDHFHPIIAALAPLYWLWDDPRMLNIAMTALLVSTAIPVYLVVRGWFGHRSGLLSAAALLLYWPFQAIINWDFHEIAFGVPIIAWVIWAIERHRPWLAVGLSAILLLVREDLGVTLIAIALVLALRRWWLPALTTAALGGLGYWFATEVVIPHFSPAGEFGYWEFTALGASAGAAVAFMLTQPWNAAVVLVDHPLKVGLWLLHFLPLWLLPFASPYVIIGAPILLSRLFNDRLNVWAPVYQYDAILAPVFLLAALDVLRRIAARTAPRTAGRLAVALPSTVLAVSLIGTLFFPQVFPFQRTLTAGNWEMTERAQAHERAVAVIPDGVCIEAADTAVPHLVDRTRVGLNGTTDAERLSWLIIDDRVEELGGSDPLTPREAFDRAEQLGFEPVIADDQGLWVFTRELDDDVDTTRCAEYLAR
ncbi:DUF2079 domain-containing protein [Nesterenkonia xinjiangensis]|uniref:Putative membrane protein n=2 Tax=Nesterenkonia xinjiangensis TaxID=225327 RepID=A0A7Z0GP62_9MICC|nr:DUF2079 domain-containing protein [Nesterenkonia xinjiangensis]NYJ79605.1 putative membrane protein [Nesterenkonia xinjiangensis]